METIAIKSPSDLTKSELNSFADLILEGGQINSPKNILIENIKNCELVAQLHIDGKLAGIGAIKLPRPSYHNRVFTKAGISNLQKNYEKELGYIFTSPEFRGRKISTKVLNSLLEKLNDQKVFATTKSQFMRAILIESGFKKKGNTYQNDDGEDLELFCSENTN